LLLITLFLRGLFKDASVIRKLSMKSHDRVICEWCTRMQAHTQRGEGGGCRAAAPSKPILKRNIL